MGRFIAAAIGGLIASALFIAALVMGVVALDRGLSRWLRDPSLGAAFAMAALLLLGLIGVLVAYACLRRRPRAAPPPELGQAVSDFARRSPWITVAAAFAAGFLASGSKTTEQLLAEILKQAQRE
ncbi:MAG TPA: hypothetical protein VJL84_03565 [Kiloniellales bacterium]|nr:hypothetical protein [Kiloniellales bacterium]